MTEHNLRDARLAQALRHMPDAHMQPDAQARLAVLKHAQEAVKHGAGTAGQAPAKARRWWQRTYPTAWGGALASVLVASFITLMWYGQPMPDANPEGLPAAQDAAVPAAPPAIAKPAPLPPPAEPMLAEKKREVRAPAPPPPAPVARYDKAAEIAAPAAPAPVPAPAPPPPPRAIAAAPATAVADMPSAPPPAASALAPSPAGASAIGTLQRHRAERTSVAGVTMTYASKSSSLTPERAAPVLAALRALSRAADAHNPQTANMPPPTITVVSAQGDRWEIWSNTLRLQTAAAPDAEPPLTVQSFAISPAQYENLRTLVDAALAP